MFCTQCGSSNLNEAVVGMLETRDMNAEIKKSTRSRYF